MKVIYDNLCNEIWDDEFLDSKIIWSIECAKREDPSFDFNWCYKGDWSLLMNAVWVDRKELVKYILADHNINVNYRDHHGHTALRNSYYTTNIHILKLLLGHKDINVNIQDQNGRTGLNEACWCGCIESVKELLVDARINPLIRDNFGKTARDVAIQDGCRGIANILGRIGRTSLLRIPNASLCRDIVRMIIEEYM